MRLRDLIHQKRPGADMVALSDPQVTPYAEVHLASSDQATERAGLVRKEILRTGSWPVIPTRGGTLNKPLTIVRDGESNKDKGIISISEVYENFKKVGQRVQVPLTDDNDDHANAIRTNTGFVEELEIVDNGGGDSRLVAYIRFTEDDVKEKVLRGTFADVSCGIPFSFRSRGESYGTVLEHVAITNRPFIDGLGDFLALSDGDDPVQRQVDHYAASPAPQVDTVAHASEIPPASPPQVKVVDPFGGLSFKQVMEQARQVVPEDMRETFNVIDVKANGVVVQNDDTKMALRIPFKIEENRMVSSNEGWARVAYEGEATPLAEHKPAAPSPDPVVDDPEETPVVPESSGDPMDRDLEAARQARQVRLGAVAASTTPNKEANMPLSREELEQLNLSDMPEGQRAAFQKLLDENVSLSAQSRTGEADKRITELEDLGLKNKPGALKLYRQVMLADDGGPAVVVLSDDGKTKQSKTALSILDEFIDAIKGADDKIVLSDQAAVVPGDNPPPVTPEGDQKPLEDRLAEAKAALAGVHGS